MRYHSLSSIGAPYLLNGMCVAAPLLSMSGLIRHGHDFDFFKLGQIEYSNLVTDVAALLATDVRSPVGMCSLIFR